MPITITITKFVDPSGERRGCLFDAYYGDRLLVAASRTPFLDSARELIRIGADPDDIVEMRRRGSSVVCLRARIGVAAGLTVDEHPRPRFRRWRTWDTAAPAAKARPARPGHQAQVEKRFFGEAAE